MLESQSSSDNLLQVKHTRVPQRMVQGCRTLPLVERGELLTASARTEDKIKDQLKDYPGGDFSVDVKLFSVINQTGGNRLAVTTLKSTHLQSVMT